MKLHFLRLKPGDDLKRGIEKFAFKHHIRAGFVVSCVGSLRRACLRLADASIIKEYEQMFEITSLVGTISPDGVHMHISLADEKGNVIGGHLKEECLIFTTAEIVIGSTDDYVFRREEDQETGYKELIIEEVF